MFIETSADKDQIVTNLLVQSSNMQLMSSTKPEVQLNLDHWRDLTSHDFLLPFTASILNQHHNGLKEARQGGSLTDQSTNSATYSSIEWNSKMSSC